jgi:3-deoxy-D-manno-octulosonate 8-phosphate phosphatase (KDO 8-P phosphatase)
VPQGGIDDTGRLAGIRALVLDVDGVLTDGTLHFDGEGRELKAFHVHDGAGLVYWRRTQHLTAFISGRESRVVRDRALELKIDEVFLGPRPKIESYEEILGRHGLRDDEVCYVGDDLLDLPILRRCGLAVTVPAGRPEVKAVCHWVTTTEAGRGAVREVVERLLKAKGLWDAIVQSGGRPC